jgi:hypothetical protein
MPGREESKPLEHGVGKLAADSAMMRPRDSRAALYRRELFTAYGAARLIAFCRSRGEQDDRMQPLAVTVELID